MRRVGGNQVSKSKYAQKKEEEDEEEIDFAQEDLYGETEKPDTATSNTKNLNIVEENVTNENNQFEKLNIDENIINNLLANEEGKNEEEIKINQNELVNAMRELEDVSNSSRDDSQISVNEGNLIILNISFLVFFSAKIYTNNLRTIINGLFLDYLFSKMFCLF